MEERTELLETIEEATVNNEVVDLTSDEKSEAESIKDGFSAGILLGCIGVGAGWLMYKGAKAGINKLDEAIKKHREKKEARSKKSEDVVVEIISDKEDVPE